jgi:signal transduction histidine kinase
MAAKILIVEDEQIIADDLREMLECLGYDVPLVLASGEAAIVQAAALRPDLVLMDIQLAGDIDGIKASIQIQSQFNIPVIFLTGNADQTTLERVKTSQSFGYLLKPFDGNLLSTTIEIALNHHRTEIAVRQALLVAEANRRTAEQQNQQKSEYLAITAHEFRNPLTAIQFATEMLQERGEKLSRKKQQKHVKRIQTATDTLNEMLDHMLLLGQAEIGKLSYEPAPLEVVSFCHDQIAATQTMVGEQYTLKFSASVQQCMAHLDAKLLRHLLQNLLSNAIKYSPEAGTITVILTCQPDQLQLKIQDQGIGIPVEAQPQLFQPFYRANNVGTITGTGLGLTVVKQCVDLHDGTIQIDSIPGKGTTVCVMLPLLDPEADQVKTSKVLKTEN